MNYKYRRTIFYLTMGVMGIGMATFSFTADMPASTNGSQNILPITSLGPSPSAALTADSSNKTPTITNEISQTPMPTAVPSNDLLLDAYPEINELINAYLTAKLDSTSTFEGIVMNANNIDSELLYKKTEYIKNYHNIKCYTKKSINEIDYIVYVTYDIELPIIETYSPSIDEFYVTLDDNGQPLIYFGDLSEETQDYILEVRNSDDVKELWQAIEEQLLQAIESDSELKEFVDKLKSSTQ